MPRPVRVFALALRRRANGRPALLLGRTPGIAEVLPFLDRTMLLVALTACKNAPTDPPAPVAIDALEFALGDDVRLVLPIAMLELGMQPRGETDNFSYIPKYTEQAGVRWLAPTGAVREQDTVTLSYTNGRSATITLAADGPDRWKLHWTADVEDTAYFRMTAVGDPTEGFYGLGEYFDHPHHRGLVRDLQLDPDGLTESGYNEAHVPIPFVIGTSGWGLFVRDDHAMRFEVATEADDEVRVTVGTGIASGDGLEFEIYVAERPLDLTKHYYESTGYPALPAPWALGPILWRNANVDQAEVEGDLAAMRDLDLAANAVWIDRPYATAVNSFDFDVNYPDPDAMIARAHEQGFRMGLWHTPYAEEATGAVHDEAVANGYFVSEVPDIVLQVVNWGALIDFTNPAANTWWIDRVRAYTDQGVEGFKLDFAEDVIPGVLPFRLPWTFHDGSDERTMHHHYQRLYHQAYREALGEGNGFLLCRTGAWGDQVNGTIIWPGDIDGNLALHGERVDDYVAVGGLPAAVSASIGLGPSGFPFFGSDTGGYRHTPPDKETFTRWFEHTALSSVMQIGTGSSDVAWEFERDWDQAMLDDYRFYTRLHLRLWPYAWTHAHRIAETGHPIQRPLGLAHPELGHFDFDYLFGDDLLVAPVVRPGEVTRRVLLPAGAWYDWFDGTVLQGGEHTVDAPLSKLPLFLRQGGIVPMLRPTIDTLAPSTAPDVESFVNDAGMLYVRVFPGEASEFVLYDGTVLTTEATGGGATLGYTAGSVFDAGAVFEVVGLGPDALEATLTSSGTTSVTP